MGRARSYTRRDTTRTGGASSWLEPHEVVAGEHAIDRLAQAVAVGDKRVDLALDGGGRYAEATVDDVGLAERPVPHAGDRALSDLWIARDLVAQRGEVRIVDRRASGAPRELLARRQIIEARRGRWRHLRQRRGHDERGLILAGLVEV